MEHMNPSRIYLGMPLRSDTLDIYLPRTGIERGLRAVLPQLHGTFLDVGCGQQPYRDLIMEQGRLEKYLGLDLDVAGDIGYTVKPDLLWNGVVMPLQGASVDSAMATEVLEHCFDPAAVLAEVNRVLKPGGVFFLTVPFLWPLHDVPHDEYRYTPFSLQRHLAQAGFTDIQVHAMGGWNASLAQMIGLYVRRAPMGPRKRRMLSALLLPLVRYLIRRDRVPDPLSKPMITGLWAVARKA
jgi:SAM-dependent methyltransferase